MRNRLRLAVWTATAIALLGVLVLVVVAFVVLPRPAVQQWLGGRLSQALGPAVDFRAVEPAFWPTPGIRLVAVRLGGEDAGPTAESLACTFQLRALLAGEIVVNRVSVDSPALSITRTEAGELRLDGLEDLRQLSVGAGAGAEKPRAALPRHLEIRDGSVAWKDRRVAGGPVAIQLRDLAASLELGRGGKRVDVRLSASAGGEARIEITGSLDPGEPFAGTAFEAEVRGRSLESDTALLYLLFGLPIRNPGGAFDIAGTVSGRFTGDVAGSARLDVTRGDAEGWGIRVGAPVGLTAAFEVKRRRFTMSGARLEADTAGFDRFDAGRTTAEFDWAESRLQLRSVDLAAYGGTWHASGSIDFHGQPTFDTQVEAADVAFRDLAGAATGEPVQGGFDLMEARARIGGRWLGAEAWRDGLEGAGSVRFTGGALPSSRVLSSVFKAVFGWVPGIRDLAAGDPAASTKLDRLDASFTLADGRATTKDLDLVADAYRLKGRGSVRLTGAMDITAKVALTADGLEQIYVLAAMPFRGTEDRSLPAIPVRITGDVGNPTVTTDVAHLSLAPFRLLFGGAAGAVDRLLDVARPRGRTR